MQTHQQLDLWLTEYQALEENVISQMIRLFKGDTRRVMQQKPTGGYGVLHSGKLTHNDLRRHLRGDISVSIYLLDEDAKCSTLCFDIDIPKIELPSSAQEREEKKRSEFLPIVKKAVDYLRTTFDLHDNCFLIEDTGGRGYHVWMFFEEPQSAHTVIAFAQKVKRDTELENLEIFPPVAKHGPSGYSKSNVRLPLGINRKYPGTRSIFLDLKTGIAIPAAKMAAYLSRVAFVPPNILVDVRIATDEEAKTELEKVEGEPHDVSEVSEAKKFFGKLGKMLSLCPALSTLESKAKGDGHLKHHERLVLALILKHCKDGESRLHEIMRYCTDYSASETQKHINSLSGYYPISCRRLQSCEYNVCSGWCCSHMEEANAAGQSPTPLWFARLWKPRRGMQTDIAGYSIIGTIASISNLHQAWKQARTQARERDVFEDVQAFQVFEENLWANLHILRTELLSGSWKHQPFRTTGIPKEKGNKESVRPMCWASPWDSVVTLAVLNVIGPPIDSTFHDNSLGNRLARGPKADGQIFEDWRKQNRLREIRREGFSEYGKEYQYFLADINRFYEFVRHDRLMTLLRARIDDQKTLDIIQQFLEAECLFDGTSRKSPATQGDGIGIPQAPALSAFLANLYLDDLDNWLDQRSVDFIRYVDDMAILCENEKHAENMMIELKSVLSQKFGLNLSDDPKKTQGPFRANDMDPIQDWVRDARYELFKYTRRAGSLTSIERSEMRDALELISGARLDKEADLERFIKYLGFYIATTERLEEPELQKGVYSLAFYVLNEERPRHNATCIAMRAMIKACSEFGEDAWGELEQLLKSREDDYIRIVLAQEARRFLQENEPSRKLHSSILKTLEEQAASSSLAPAAAAITCLTFSGDISVKCRDILWQIFLGDEPYLRPRAAILLSTLQALNSTAAARVIPADGNEAAILLNGMRSALSKDVVDSIAEHLKNAPFRCHAVPELLFSSLLANSEKGIASCLEYMCFESPENYRDVCLYIAAKYIDGIVTGEIQGADLESAISSAASANLLTLAKHLYDLGRYAKIVGEIDQIQTLLEPGGIEEGGKVSIASLPRINKVELGDPLVSVTSRAWLHEAVGPDEMKLYHEVICGSELQPLGQSVSALLEALETMKHEKLLVLDKCERKEIRGDEYVLAVTARDGEWQTVADLIHGFEKVEEENCGDILKKAVRLITNTIHVFDKHNLSDELIPVPSTHTLVINSNGELMFRNVVLSVAGGRRYIGLSMSSLGIPREKWKVFALGLLFFEIVTSRCAVATISGLSRSERLAECPESQVAGALFAGIIGKATAHRPDNRYESPELFFRDVSEWCNLEIALKSQGVGKVLKERLRHLLHIELGLERRREVLGKDLRGVFEVSLNLANYIFEELRKGGELEDDWLVPYVKDLGLNESKNELHVATIQILNLAEGLEGQWRTLTDNIKFRKEFTCPTWLKLAAAGIEIEAARRSIYELVHSNLRSLCQDVCINLTIAFREGQKVEIDKMKYQDRISQETVMKLEDCLPKASERLSRWLESPIPEPQWHDDLPAIATLLMAAKEGLNLKVSHSGKVELGPVPFFEPFEDFGQLIGDLLRLHDFTLEWIDIALKSSELLKQKTEEALALVRSLSQLNLTQRKFGLLPKSAFQQLYAHKLAGLNLADVLGMQGRELLANRSTILPFPSLSFHHGEDCPFSADLLEVDKGFYRVAALSLPPVVRRDEYGLVYPVLPHHRYVGLTEHILAVARPFWGWHIILLILSVFSYLWQVYAREAGLLPGSSWISALDGWITSFGMCILLPLYVRITFQRFKKN